MNLSDFILTVATTYDVTDGLRSPAQEFLKSARWELAEHAPAGIAIRSGGGKGQPAFTPWFGFFNPDETLDPQRGIYVVYLFARDLKSVTLSLNQGMEHLRKELGDAQARARLRGDAALIRAALPSAQDLDADIDISASSDRQKNYEAGNVAARRYATGSLPSEQQLRTDLTRFLDLYSEALLARNRLLLTSPGTLSMPGATDDLPAVADPFVNFRPKDDSDYVARIVGTELRKKRRHETIVREYGSWVRDNGWNPSTGEHPLDLVLRQRDAEWLVEVKVLYRGNAMDAVRAAIGQLFAYRHFIYSDLDSIRLAAVFSEPIGNAFARFLETHGIASVWHTSGTWAGTRGAVDADLAVAPEGE